MQQQDQPRRREQYVERKPALASSRDRQQIERPTQESPAHDRWIESQLEEPERWDGMS